MSATPTVELALEASTREPSVALSVGGALHECLLDGERAHASDLAPSIAELLARAGAEPAELSHLIVGTGPGSLTGLRAAAATAIGLARATGAELSGVPSIAARAHAAHAQGLRGRVLIVEDIRAGHLAAQSFDLGTGDASGLTQVAPADDPRAIPYAEFAATLSAAAPDLLLVAGKPLLKLLLQNPATSEACAVHPAPAPHATALLALAHLAVPSVEPLYLRPFGAK